MTLEGVVWDNQIKKQTKEQERMAGERVTITEEYVTNPKPDRLRLWIEEQQNYRLMMLRKVENSQLFQKRLAFGEGKTVGRMLAFLVKTNSPHL